MLSVVFNNPTPDYLLEAIKEKEVKGFTLLKSKDCFFIWKSLKGIHYKRICLIRSTSVEDNSIYFYWNLEQDFRPFNYKHNNRENANIKSECFEFNEMDKFRNYFENLLNMIK